MFFELSAIDLVRDPLLVSTIEQFLGLCRPVARLFKSGVHMCMGLVTLM